METFVGIEDSALQELSSAVLALRVLHFEGSRVSSLRFLRHASQLEELHLEQCDVVRTAHLLVLGTVAPQLSMLRLRECSGVRLDE